MKTFQEMLLGFPLAWIVLIAVFSVSKAFAEKSCTKRELEEASRVARNQTLMQVIDVCRIADPITLEFHLDEQIYPIICYTPMRGE
jgi:hypothetical protein